MIKHRMAHAMSRFVVAALLHAPWVSGVHADTCDGARAAMVQMAADRIDAVFHDVAASTRAIGEAYRHLHPLSEPADDPSSASWLERRTQNGRTAGFRTWPEDAPPPAFQAPFAGLYSYTGDRLTTSDVARLQAFERLIPVFRTAYHSFDFSWVYLTTPDELMLIYPYVPLDEAVHNDPPTNQVYYTAADFEGRRVGWTAPYLDLVGAGLMITASYPVYRGDTLIGVSSRDITLQQLSRSVLAHLVENPSTVALLVDRKGLAIEASDPRLVAELETVNRDHRAAVLYYRTAPAHAGLSERNAVGSRYGWANRTTEQVLQAAENRGNDRIIQLEAEGRWVLAAPVKSTGWFVILTLSHDPGRGASPVGNG